MEDQLRVGHEGAPITATVRENGMIVDLSTATVMIFKFKKPSKIGGVIERTASLLTDGTDGKLVYITVEDDLDEAGPWQLQARVELADGKWHTDLSTFVVAGNLS